MAGASAFHPTSEVEVSISCRNLQDCDFISVTNPMAVVFHKPSASVDWIELTRTECIGSNNNPDFVTKIKMTYFFELQQMLKFSIYDAKSESANLQQCNFLGSTEVTLGQIVSSRIFDAPLFNSFRNCRFGSIIVIAEELPACKEELKIQFFGKNLVNRKMFGSHLSPFLEFYKLNEEGLFVLVHRTSPVHKTSNPLWDEFSVPLRSFCNGDYNKTIEVVCKDLYLEKSGEHKVLGSFTTNVKTLSTGPGSQNDYVLVNENLKRYEGSKYEPEGEICVKYSTIKEAYSFIDYLRAGTELYAFIAIDFTASNGNPQQADSLHSINHTPNQYQQAIKDVGEIIEGYDSHKSFPVLGFGARLPPHFEKASDLFFVNGHEADPHCHGVEGVLDAYQFCINRVQLFEPTNLSPIIQHVAQFAQAFPRGNKYFILLIITDGVISDMEATKKEIVKAAGFPLSIIIVGVGNADFKAMEELGSDKAKVSYGDHEASRDIVHFVPFRDFQNKLGSERPDIKHLLARKVLAKVPDQFLSYMVAQNVAPGGLCNAHIVSNVPETAPIPSVPETAPIPSVPEAALIPSVPEAALIPSVPEAAPIPSVPEAAPIPNVPKIYPVPNVSKIYPVPNVPKIYPVPNVPETAPISNVPETAQMLPPVHVADSASNCQDRQTNGQRRKSDKCVYVSVFVIIFMIFMGCLIHVLPLFNH